MSINSVFKLNNNAQADSRRHMSSTLSSRIVSTVREGLLDSTLNSGDMLGTEADLSQRFGVSRVAARDALKRLEAMGVVEIRAGAGGGARIASGNTQLFADVLAVQLKLINANTSEILDAQRAIEMMAVQLAAVHASNEDLQSISKLLDQADAFLQDSNSFSYEASQGFTQVSFEFHLAITRAAHNEVLQMQLMAMHFVAWPSHNPTLTWEVASHVQKTHRQVFTLLQAGDGDAARSVMSRHLTQIRDRRVSESSQPPFQASCC
jgi:GntR family transcriptional regulator, transcriptional repressor for pyruvate dehydrogenase complex